MGLRLQRRARRGRTGRNRKARKRRDGSSLLDRVHLRTGGHDAQAAARRDSRGGLETPREPQRVGSRGGDRAGRGEGGHGEGTGSGRARHAAAPRARWSGGVGVTACVECRAPRRLVSGVSPRGRNETAGGETRGRSSGPATRKKTIMGLALGLGWRSSSVYSILLSKKKKSVYSILLQFCSLF